MAEVIRMSMVTLSRMWAIMPFVNADDSYPEGYKYHACTRVILINKQSCGSVATESIKRYNAMRYLKGNLVPVSKSEF